MHNFIRHPRVYPVGRVMAVVVTVAVVMMALAALVAARPGMLGGESAVPGNGQSASSADWAPSYGSEVVPILDRACIRCHGPQRADKGLRLDSYQRMMAGDSYGTVVIPGDSSLSAIVTVLKDGTMPHGGARLTSIELETISRWIDAGARDN